MAVLGGTALLAAVLQLAEGAFPEDSTFPAVSLGLLLLLWRAMAGGLAGRGAVANALGLCLALLFGMILLLGLKSVAWAEAGATDISWESCCLALLGTVPWWPLRGKMDKRAWCWYGGSGLTALGLGCLVLGTLGRGLAQAEKYPVYRAVQTLRFLGSLQHLEALMAAAVLMGAFCLMLMGAEPISQGLESLLPNVPVRWPMAGVCLGAFLLEWAWRQGTWQEIPGLQTIFCVLSMAWILWVGNGENVEKITKNS